MSKKTLELDLNPFQNISPYLLFKTRKPSTSGKNLNVSTTEFCTWLKTPCPRGRYKDPNASPTPGHFEQLHTCQERLAQTSGDWQHGMKL